jgi:hypothetical protein
MCAVPPRIYFVDAPDRWDDAIAGAARQIGGHLILDRHLGTAGRRGGRSVPRQFGRRDGQRESLCQRITDRSDDYQRVRLSGRELARGLP